LKSSPRPRLLPSKHRDRSSTIRDPVRQSPRNAQLSRLVGTGLWTSRFLSREERDALGNVVVSTRSVSANTDLVRQGERADSLFIVADGWACRYTTTREGGRQFPALMVPGDVGNLDSLMFDRLDYGVRTLTQATIVTLPRDRVLALAAQHPGIGRTFTWLALVENAILSIWALSLGRRSAKERLVHLLCELSVRLDAEDGNESSFAFPLTQEHIADAPGLTNIHVNRTNAAASEYWYDRNREPGHDPAGRAEPARYLRVRSELSAYSTVRRSTVGIE